MKTLRNILRLAAAAAAITTACAAHADDQHLTFVDGRARFDGVGQLLAGGDDLITFSGLEPGRYEFALAWSGMNVSLMHESNVNGTHGSMLSDDQWVFVDVTGHDEPPFVLRLIGFAAPGASYYGEIAVQPAVPEPATWMLVSAGFAAIGFVARRRRK